MENDLDLSNRVGDDADLRTLVEVGILAPTAIMGLLPGVRVPRTLIVASIAVIGFRAFEKVKSL